MKRMQLTAAILMCALKLTNVLAESGPVLNVAVGVKEDGSASDQWLAMLRKRLSPATYDGVAPVKKALTADEAAWLTLIRTRAPMWERELTGLAEPFAPIRGPQHAVIVVGNRGASDAFAHDATTIGFDASALRSEYGPAIAADNPDRMDRLFRHEYTHLLQKAWLAEHPYDDMQSPLRAAIADIWAEGLGNYHSLSARWRATSGAHPAPASATLATLEPRFVARLAAIACASPEHAAVLSADLSSGPFDRKWGALPVALWLDVDAGGSVGALRAFVQSGPDGVWELANRHLPATLRPVLKEARLADETCRAAPK